VISDRTRSVIIYVVLLVWAVNFFAPFVLKEFQPDPAINGIFMAVIGAVLVIRPRRKEDDKDGDLPA
jgi:drug/metabolite transporter (DMT)-like permease